MKRARRRIPIYVPGQEFAPETFTPVHQPLIHGPNFMPSTTHGSALSKHRPGGGGGGGGGGGLTFEGQSNWTRPYAKSGMNPVPFTTLGELNTAISNMQGGDYIFWNGPSGTIFSNSTGNILNIQNKRPTSRVVIDFGTRFSTWNPGLQGSWCGFKYTGTAYGQDACYINNCSNISFYGGHVQSHYGYGVIFQGDNHDIDWFDGYIFDTGIMGCHLRGNHGDGTAAEVYNVRVRFEIDTFAQNPTDDVAHADKGSGIHAFLFHDTGHGNLHDNTIAIYVHDSLQPGQADAHGTIMPEGAGGSACEIGSPADLETNNTFFIKAVNLGMIPNGTNPGSTARQTGGNVINAWGNVKFNGMVVGWLEGNTCTGQLVSAAGGSYWPGNPAMHVLHGRWHNINLSTAGSNAPEPYATFTKTGTALNFIYDDMQSY